MKLVNLNIAKTLQELGYDGEYSKMYNTSGQLMEIDEIAKPYCTPAPRLDDAAYWIKDRYGIFLYITYSPSDHRFLYDLIDMYWRYDLSKRWKNWRLTATYNEALEIAVNEALSIIKNNL